MSGLAYLFKNRRHGYPQPCDCQLSDQANDRYQQPVSTLATLRRSYLFLSLVICASVSNFVHSNLGYANDYVAIHVATNQLAAGQLATEQLATGQRLGIAEDSNVKLQGAEAMNALLAGSGLHFNNSQVDTEKAFQSLRRTTWYDPASKDFAPPEINPERDNALRTDGKAAEATSANKSAWDWGSFGDWFGGLGRFLSSFFSWAILVVIAVALTIAVLALLFFMFRDYLPNRSQQTTAKTGIEVDLARVEELPFDVRSSALDPLSEAQRLMQAGNYDAAIVYLYGYMLLVLDHSRQIHLQKGKTNRMYLRELSRGGNASLRRIVESTMLAFEQVYFGKHSLPAQHFQTLWGQVEEFHYLINTKSDSERVRSAVEIAPI